ncbi:MAG: hypothetical protein JO208_12835 [Alphaproteobacteria bacterium]|nr:hypothetical protein [Alphaproteobacteria bacterium]
MPPCLFLVALLALASAGTTAYAGTYTNPQFGYSIHYPSKLLRPLASHTAEGQAFAAVVGHAGFRVFAARRNGQSPQEFADDAQTVCPGSQPSYHVAKARLVAISCRAGDHIVYQKSQLRGDYAVTVRAEYPAKERWIWDRVVTSIADSMSAAPMDTSYAD